LKSWEEADEALRSIGTYERLIARHEADLGDEIACATSRTLDKTKPLTAKRSALALQLAAFCEDHKDEMKGKSRVLNFGTVSFRQSTKIVIRSLEGCLQSLKNLGLFAYFRVQEIPDKEKLKDLDDATLLQLGVRRQVKDVFGYDVNWEKIKEAA